MADAWSCPRTPLGEPSGDHEILSPFRHLRGGEVVVPSGPNPRPRGHPMITLLLSLLSHAFTVTSTADVPDYDLTDGLCTSGSPTGPCTLRAAVMQSNHDGIPVVIDVPAGVHTLSVRGSSSSDAEGDFRITNVDTTVRCLQGAEITTTVRARLFHVDTARTSPSMDASCTPATSGVRRAWAPPSSSASAPCTCATRSFATSWPTHRVAPSGLSGAMHPSRTPSCAATG